MPGRDRSEAFWAFRQPFEESFRCLTVKEQLKFRWATPDVAVVASATGKPIQLATATSGVWFELHLVMVLRLIPADEGQFRMTTINYIYDVHDCRPNERKEVVQWHWHPDRTPAIRWPHMHLPKGSPHTRRHVPCGRITFEQVALFLIGELGARPGNNRWNRTLPANMRLQRRHSSW